MFKSCTCRSRVRTRAAGLFAAAMCAATMSVTAQTTNWVAYNDHAPSANTHPNATGYNMRGVAATTAAGSVLTGNLKSFVTGGDLPVVFTSSAVGTPDDFGASANPTAGTDAYNLFNGIVDLGNDNSMIGVRSSSGSKSIVTISGLDPSKAYVFKGTAVRGNNYTRRWTLVTLEGADSFVEDHSASGVYTAANYPAGGMTTLQAAFNSGENRTGAVVGWREINPGADGTITITSEQFVPATLPNGETPDTGAYGYGINSMMLAEIETGPPQAPMIVTAPVNTTGLQCRPVSLTVVASGSFPLSYQWYKDNNPIQDATSATYTLNNPQPGDSGSYHVVVSNGAGTAPSTAATLTIAPDTQAPLPLYAIGQPDGSTIRLTFDEPVSADVAASTFNYEMYVVGNSNAPTLANSAVIENETNVVLTTEFPRVSGQNYFLRILGRKDACAANEAFTAVDVHLVQMIELLAVDGVTTTWQYNEQNIDLGGTGWQNLGYDDSSWLTGIGVLTQVGNEAGLPAGWVGTATLTAQNAGGPETTYFRGNFNLPSTPGSVLVQFTHAIDDGAVFYVNGTEIGRIRMPTGAFNHATDGSNSPEPHPEEGPIVVPGSTLFGGNNVMAVEVHQSGTASSDVAMGVKMVAWVTNFSSGLSIAAQPQDLTVNEGQPASLSVTAEGAVPFTYQWRKDGAPISGANGPTLNFAAALPSDSGDYDVIITNPAGTTNSEVATLTVVPDTTAPTVLRVLGDVDLTTFRVTFSEPVDELSAEEIFSYIINQVGGGGDLAITSATLTDGTNLVIVTQDPRVQGVDYELEVLNVYDRSVAQNVVTPSTYRIASGIAILMPDDITLWQYDQSGVDNTGNGWNTPGFDASTWPVGLAGFSTPTPEIVPAGFELRTTTLVAPDSGGPRTVYFRTQFDFPGSLSGAFLEAYGVIDDGAVFYINGTDAGRLRMPADPITFATEATGASPEASNVHTESGTFLSTAGVQASGNLLAVELHQSGNSSDSLLSMKLIAYVTEFGSVPTGPELTVTRNATTGEVTISWTGGGTLQSSTVVGPGAVWTAIPGATSPFTFTPSGDQGYFRVQQ